MERGEVEGGGVVKAEVGLFKSGVGSLSGGSGATSGIGAETARVLALRGVHVIMAVRNMAAARDVKEVMERDIPSAKIDAMELDLSSMASVRKFASEFNSSGLPLNLLINNAGIMATPFMLSKDGIELQFATNHLGHFLLTNLLLERMKRTALNRNREGRIINVSSRRHQLSYPEGIPFGKINDPAGYHSLSAYGQSKLANVLHANELARRLKEDRVEITANSVHPGVVDTDIFRHHSLFRGLVNLVGQLIVKSVQQGAATTCYVALHPDVKGVRGKYFGDCDIAKASSQSNDADLARKLWDFSSNLVK
ncbi:short-chain dehydrogenase TIC 32, chloroplastic-like isoform X2 [Chenopodium quinoa]|uniref:short-chain dehydrogenase TIC 32, chloroplastic-like isoform X2 n=1 Tax=Chenopodium quinoa TaxID=63459 RepID=UPI000B77E978|nr:short-chain dehydrogenase TIC 32, chloroplastic-like isoform X2 [Chenopodium quinoa]